MWKILSTDAKFSMGPPMQNETHPKSNPAHPNRPSILVAVTGASGRLGRQTLSLLKKRHVRCVGLVRSAESAGKLPRGVPGRIVDYTDVDSLADALADATHIVNCTGAPDSGLSMPQLMAANVSPTQHLLVAVPPHIRRFVHISSISVYGWHPPQKANEFSKRNPDTAYAASKIAAERSALARSHLFPVVVLQPGMIYGPEFHAGFWPALKQLKAGSMRLIGNGDNRLPLVHVDDVAEGIWCALFAPVPSGSVFLLVGSENITQSSAMTSAARELKVRPPASGAHPVLAYTLAHTHSLIRRLQGRSTSFTPDMLRQLSSDRTFDCTRARTMLHWRPAVAFKTGLREVISEFRKNRETRMKKGRNKKE